VGLGQAVVTGAGSVAAFGVQMVQETGDEFVVELGEPHLLWWCAGGLLGVVQQQPPGVAIAGNGVGAGISVLHQLDAEESLQDRGQGAHGVSCGGGGALWLPAVRAAARSM
jgi:hypothetical protein